MLPLRRNQHSGATSRIRRVAAFVLTIGAVLACFMVLRNPLTVSEIVSHQAIKSQQAVGEPTIVIHEATKAVPLAANTEPVVHSQLPLSSSPISAAPSRTRAQRGLPEISATPTPQPRLRVLVCLAVFYTADVKPLNYVTRVLEEYGDRYTARWDVRVRIDTNNDTLAAALGSHARFVNEFRVWSLEEVGGDYLRLPEKHRAPAAQGAASGAFDYLLYAEDDMLVPAEAFAFFVQHEARVAEHGWVLSFVRAETWSGDGKTLVAVDLGPRQDAQVYRYSDTDHINGAPTQLFAQPRSCHAAAYALSASSVRTLVANEPTLWTEGFPNYQIRERFGVGAAFTRSKDTHQVDGFLYYTTGKCALDRFHLH
jgi:hypothetical protein